jgi:hypothetical protein
MLIAHVLDPLNLWVLLELSHHLSLNISHHPVIRKELPGLVITPGVGQLGVLGGVLDILMPHPVLHEFQLPPRVQEVRGDRVLEAVELALLRRQACLLAIGLHGAPQRAPVDGHAAVGDEQIR